MGLAKKYKPLEAERRLQEFWEENGTYHYDKSSDAPVYSIDTPPATVSGKLHLGHVYSYSHPDFMIRYFRMKGYNVYYPMGYDDNGLPTERLVEKNLKIRATEVGRERFIQHCLEEGAVVAKGYEELWKRMALSIDWRYTYRTIDEHSRRIAQTSFLDLHRKKLAYRAEAPTIWCPHCNTAIAQAELDDLERSSEFITLDFRLENGRSLPIATTRPELLPACVAVFVHPDDDRYRKLEGAKVTVPHFNQTVPLLKDPGADPEKGTGAVMCCTFGDVTDVGWWHAHKLPLVIAIAPNGIMTDAAGEFSGLKTKEARSRIINALEESNLVLKREPITQSVRVHERCDTPVEYAVALQWFIKVLEHREQFIHAADKITWYPDYMKARYVTWVENLHWDWCISRQRYFGVPFPLWYCTECGEVNLPDETDLPVDPSVESPRKPCTCGSTSFEAEKDVMDTWFTSSLTPQIGSRWLEDDELYKQVYPMSMRPQGHEIIRTWAFYTIVKSHHHFGLVPWDNVTLSGWGLAPEGTGKISKSRGGGPMAPVAMIDKYSADAVRYWASSTSFGRDSIISEDKIRVGSRLVTKLWNVARFSERFIHPDDLPDSVSHRSPADRWILSRLQGMIRRTTDYFNEYDFAAAKSEIETFFWRDLADNYIEMSKQRLYNEESPDPAARDTLYRILLNMVKLFAPFLPHVTEEIYQGLFREADSPHSVHRTSWPEVYPAFENEKAERTGEIMVSVATAVRRYKSEQNIAMGTELPAVVIRLSDDDLRKEIMAAIPDLRSVTRAKEIVVSDSIEPTLTKLHESTELDVALKT